VRETLQPLAGGAHPPAVSDCDSAAPTGSADCARAAGSSASNSSRATLVKGTLIRSDGRRLVTKNHWQNATLDQKNQQQNTSILSELKRRKNRGKMRVITRQHEVEVRESSGQAPERRCGPRRRRRRRRRAGGGTRNGSRTKTLHQEPPNVRPNAHKCAQLAAAEECGPCINVPVAK
jgi:hypothetical protein